MSEYITDMESGRPGLMLEGLNTEPATANINTVIFRGVWLNWSFLIGHFTFLPITWRSKGLKQQNTRVRKMNMAHY